MALPALVGALGGAARAGAAGASALGAPQTAATFSKLANSLHLVSFAGRAAGDVMSQMGGIINRAISPLTLTVGLFRQMETAVTGLGHAVGHFVAKVSPAHFKLFQFAADDFAAAIGRGLLPVMEFATRVTRGFADVVFAFSGPLNRLLSATLGPLGDYIPHLVNAFGPLARAFGSLVNVVTAVTRPFNTMLMTLARVGAVLAEISFEVMANGLELLLAPLEAIIRVAGDAVIALANFINNGLKRLREFFGLRDAAGGSVGAAVRQTQISSVESFQQRALMAAFMGGAGGPSPEEKTSTYAEKIYLWLLELPGKVATELAKLPPEIATKLWEVLKNALPGASTAAEIAANPGRAPEIIAREGRELGRQISDSPLRFLAGQALRPVDPLNLLGAR